MKDKLRKLILRFLYRLYLRNMQKFNLPTPSVERLILTTWWILDRDLLDEIVFDDYIPMDIGYQTVDALLDDLRKVVFLMDNGEYVDTRTCLGVDGPPCNLRVFLETEDGRPVNIVRALFVLLEWLAAFKESMDAFGNAEPERDYYRRKSQALFIKINTFLEALISSALTTHVKRTTR